MNSKILAAGVIIAELNAEKYFKDEEYRKTKQLLAGMGVGGFCVFKGSLDETKRMLSELQDIAEERLILCGDFEFGLPMRITDAGTGFPHAMALGKNPEYMETYKNARLIARECKALGINWNFAPVCDINNNPKNPIINIRSFGEDKETVALHSSAFIRGLQDEHVISCAKHFPGHGDTTEDSHLSLPVLDFSRERLEETELYPFQKAIENGVRSIMIGHLSVPSLDSTGTPASLSYEIITNYLRGELAYEGLIVTDALRMEGLASTYSGQKAAEIALRAGSTVALMPENELETIDHLASIVEQDTEFRTLLERNISLLEKELAWSRDDESLRENHVIDRVHEKIALVSAYKASEVIEPSLVPLDNSKQIAAFAFLQHENDLAKASTFFHLLQQALDTEIDFGFLDQNIEREDLIELKKGIHEADIIIAAYFYKAMDSANSIGDFNKLEPIITRLAEGRPIVSISLGNPYLFDNYDLSDRILTYSDSLASQAAAVMKLTGRDIEQMLGSQNPRMN